MIKEKKQKIDEYGIIQINSTLNLLEYITKTIKEKTADVPISLNDRLWIQIKSKDKTLTHTTLFHSCVINIIKRNSEIRIEITSTTDANYGTTIITTQEMIKQEGTKMTLIDNKETTVKIAVNYRDLF